VPTSVYIDGFNLYYGTSGVPILRLIAA